MIPYLTVVIVLTFLAGCCAGLALSTHELNQDFRRMSWLMTIIFLSGAGMFAYLGVLNGR